MTYLLTLLIIAPALTFWYARRRRPTNTFAVSGFVFGVVVSPWALGLYSLYYLSPWGIVPGLVGLVMTLVHGEPGFVVASHLGWIPVGVVSEFKSQAVVEAINAFVWAAVYGTLGLAIDRVRLKASL
jgi:hypothetical protein